MAGREMIVGKHTATSKDWHICPFNPKPEAMAGSGMDSPHVAPAIASGFGLNEPSPSSLPKALFYLNSAKTGKCTAYFSRIRWENAS